MKIAVTLLCIFISLQADFLENFYVELKELNLTKEQEIKLKNIIREHHIFLRQWYLSSKKNDDKIMESFFNSSLNEDSPEIAEALNLANERFRVQQQFLILVYDILDVKQRALLGDKIKQRAMSNKFLYDDEPEHSQELGKMDMEGDLFGDIKFKRYDFNKTYNTKRIFLDK